MAQLPNAIHHNLENGQIYIPLFINGVHVNRSPLYTPITQMGIQLVQRLDTLWGGSNMELSMQNTLVRRPGFPKFSTQKLNSGVVPLQFYSYKNLAGTISTFVDTQYSVDIFTPTTVTAVYYKETTVQTSFQKVGNCLYLTDGTEFQAVADNGTIGSPRPVGIAVPTVAPAFTIGSNGFLLPTTGFTYGYSYGNSTSGHISTMSPISSDVGDLDVLSVTESSIKVSIGSVSCSGQSAGPPLVAGTVTFGTPNGNNFWVGQGVTVQGFNNINNVVNYTLMNGGYTITAVTSSSFSASTAQWGQATGSQYVFNCASDVEISNCTGVTAVANPITIPGSGAADPYVYTVVQAANFAPTNAWDAVTPSPLSVTGPGGSPVYTQIQSGTPTGYQFVCNASTGQLTFASAEAGNTIIVTYAVTPVTGGNPVSFVVTGPSANNGFSAGTQTDTTGYSSCDNVIIYRDQDADGVDGPWYYLATIPNDIALSAATFNTGSNQTVYTFTNTVPAGANNGFAGAANTGGAIVKGFAHAGNNGTFDIVASTSTSITCTNPSGYTETHSGTVNSGAWQYTDTGASYGYAFDPTVPDGELDLLIEAPIDDENNPPPNTTNPLTNQGSNAVTGCFSLITYYAGRMWGAVDNYVYFAGGPDVTFGNGNESWPPANVFTFPGAVTALAPVPAGLVVFTHDSMFIIYGTSTGTFYPQQYQQNLGVASQNCVVIDQDVLYIYSNQSQLWAFSDGLSEIGLNVAPLLTSYFNPASTYLTVHRMGEDVGLFVSDGSTNYMKFRIDQNSWSPMCQIVGGQKCMQSIETSTGVYTLLAGSASGAEYIYGRNLTTWTDAGGTYYCSAIIGSLIVSPPGATALIEYLTMQYMPTGTAPTISIIPQGIASLTGSGAWVQLGVGVNDPPKLVPSSSPSIVQQRFYVKGASTPIAQDMCNLQVLIQFPSENAKAEVLTLGIS